MTDLDILAVHAGARPEGVAVIEDDRVVSLHDFNALVNQYADVLRGADVRAGEKVLWVGQNSTEVVAINHAPRPLPVRDTDNFEKTRPQRGAVHALFDLDRPETGPFPTDVFTVADPSHNTGRRVNLPYPDCTVRVSDCEDLDVINTLDGFGLQTRISIPFDGSIDPSTVTD